MYYIYSHVTCRSLVRRNLHFATLKIRYIILCMMNSILLDLHEPENTTCSTLSENRACQNFTTENIQLSSDPDYQRRIPDPARHAHLSPSLIVCACSNIHLSDYRRIVPSNVPVFNFRFLDGNQSWRLNCQMVNEFIMSVSSALPVTTFLVLFVWVSGECWDLRLRKWAVSGAK